MTTQNAVTQAEFARMIGCARSYVTALKKADRLVLNAIGSVLVEESRQRIAETSDPNRDDVAQRCAADRGKNIAVDAAETALRWQENRPKTIPESELEEKIGNSYQAARAVKEKFSAMTAKLDYERAVGKVIEKSEVKDAAVDLVTMFRQNIENMPHRTAPELVGKDLDQIRATLKQEVHAALAELEKELTKRLEELGSNE